MRDGGTTAGGATRRTRSRRGLAAASRFIVLLAAGGAFAGCARDELARADGQLEVVPLFDFGPVSLGRARASALRLSNTGRATLRIDTMDFDAPSLSDFVLGSAAEVELGPGDVAEVELVFRPSALGLRASRLQLGTDSALQPLVQVELWGEGVSGRAELGEHLLDFGKVSVHGQRTLELTLTNTERTPAEVVFGALQGDDALDFSQNPGGSVAVQAGTTVGVAFRFAPPRLGRHSAFVEVQPCPTCPAERLVLQGEGIEAALVVAPAELDFGFVAPGSVAAKRVTVTNRGTSPATLRAVRTSATTDSTFAVSPPAPALPAVLLEGQSAEFEVTFTPAALDPRSGRLEIVVDGVPAQPLLVVPLKGFGGGPDIEAYPSPLSFPRAGVGVAVRKQISLRNVGYDPNGTMPLVIDRLEISGPNAAEFQHALDPARRTIAAGAASTIYVTFTPWGDRERTATLLVYSNDPDEDPLTIPLVGSGVQLGPCQYEVVPERLDFGTVAVGSRARLAFGIRNIGPDPCNFANIRLGRGTPSAFALAPISSRIIDPGDQLVVPVEFAPADPAGYSGVVEFDTTSPAAPQARVPLVARGIDACLELVPTQLDFGLVGLACRPPTRSVQVRNACVFAVDLGQSYAGTGASDEFTLDAASSAPRRLSPGDYAQLLVAYDPVDEGLDLAPLYVPTSTDPTPLLVGLEGTGALRPMNSDTFVQPPLTEVDFLMVVDNSGSLMEEQDALAQNFDRFIQAAVARGINYRLAVTTTGLTPYRGGWADCPGGVDGGEAGRFYPVTGSTPRILTPQTPDVREVFKNNVKVGVCHWWEEGLEASRLALSTPLIDHADAPNFPEVNDGNDGFLRPNAKLHVLYVSDEEDAGTVPPSTYVAFLQGLKPGRPDLVSASAIVGMPSCATAPSVGTRYMSVVNALGGLVADICSPDWGGVLQRIGDAAFSPRREFALTQAPEGREITVTLDGVEVPRTGSNGQPQWSYDPTLGDFGSVVFPVGRAPGPNTTLVISYPVPCP
jgi:hypothetical protein